MPMLKMQQYLTLLRVSAVTYRLRQRAVQTSVESYALKY